MVVMQYAVHFIILVLWSLTYKSEWR